MELHQFLTLENACRRRNAPKAAGCRRRADQHYFCARMAGPPAAGISGKNSIAKIARQYYCFRVSKQPNTTTTI
jgi:hypothetical protein